MKTGFVILNFNCWKITGRLAEKAASFEEIDAVVVVDNASTDDSYKQLKKLGGNKIKVLQSRKNGGYSYGNNLGAKMCRTLGMELMFIANPDVEIEEADVKKIKGQFAVSDYSILSGVECDAHGNVVWPVSCRRMGYWDDFFDCFYLGRRLWVKKRGDALDRGEGVWQAEMVKGSFFAVRLEDFFQAGGLDEGVFLYCEERILSRRMEKLGRKIGIVANARYLHTHSGSIRRGDSRTAPQIEMLYASRLYYHKTYHRIHAAQYALLAAAMKFSVLEYRLRDFLRPMYVRLWERKQWV